MKRLKKSLNHILRNSRIRFLSMVLFPIIAGIVYYPIFSGGFVMDDYAEIVQNKRIHSITNAPVFFTGSTFPEVGDGESTGAYYRPLEMVWLSAVYSVFGPNPHYFHIFQVGLHTINSLLVFILFLGAIPWGLSFLLSLLFLVHPFNVEAVSYIAALQDPMVFTMCLLGLLILKRAGTIIFRAIIIAFIFFAGLLIKETMIIFGIIYLIYGYLLKSRKEVYYLGGGMACVGIIYYFMRCTVADLCQTGKDFTQLSEMAFLPFLQQMPAILFFYIKTFFIPDSLLIAQHWYIKNPDFMTVGIPLIGVLLFFVFSIIGIFVLYYRSSRGLATKHREYVVYFWLITFGLLFHSHILPLDFTVADRWFYLPMVGMLGIIGIAIHEFAGERARLIIISILLFTIMGFMVRSSMRVILWRDQRALFFHDYQYNQDSFDLTNNIGTLYFNDKNYDAARVMFLRATELSPQWGIGWMNAGITAEVQGDLVQAERYYKRAVEVSHGLFIPIYVRYVSILVQQDKLDEARILLENEALIKQPGSRELLQFYRDVSERIPAHVR